MLNDYLVAPCSLTGCPDIINIFCFDIFHTSLFYGFWPTMCQGLAWAYEYMRKSKWDIHTWEFHPSSPAGMQHCSIRTGKILMEKKVKNFLRKLHSAIFIQIRRLRSWLRCFAKWYLYITKWARISKLIYWRFRLRAVVVTGGREAIAS